MQITTESAWTKTIEPSRRWYRLSFSEIWRYRYLVLIFFQRDLKASYKQTILGPLWLVIPPLLSTVVFTVIFGNIAGLSTDGIPHVLFYMSGLVVWGFFSNCVTVNANVFMANANLFSKVYFPRLVVPFANVLSTGFASIVQLVMFLGFLVYFYFARDFEGTNVSVLLLPILVLAMAMLALGVSTVIAALTVVYRDLSFLVTLGMQLWMYSSTVIYPLSSVPEKYRLLMLLNPMVPVIEAFRYGFLGQGTFDLGWIGYSLAFGVISFFVGVVIFNIAEQTAMDTV